jgi:hypothetical protein
VARAGGGVEYAAQRVTDLTDGAVTFRVQRGIFGVGSLATRLKALESIGQIGPWHIGQWIDYTHSAIRIRFSSAADGKLATLACREGI